MDNVEEMDKFLEKYNFPKLDQGRTRKSYVSAPCVKLYVFMCAHTSTCLRACVVVCAHRDCTQACVCVTVRAGLCM